MNALVRSLTTDEELSWFGIVLDLDLIHRLARGLRVNLHARRLDLTFTNLTDEWFLDLSEALIQRATMIPTIESLSASLLLPPLLHIIRQYCEPRRLHVTLSITLLTPKSLAGLRTLAEHVDVVCESCNYLPDFCSVSGAEMVPLQTWSWP
jgi:hypothetical protein